ncbi:U4/U6.U5 tri-snRNP-associated protein 2 [Geosmithia morbida]|uniref:U4/U6.U5 tri-snRNP-associated protein 2 n=1 Tax=Geosmithia morbida TaxID=1094350 RepID=A0A9P5D1H4_9HYPO|nr:U4/U6.U5 tri-snRNP-associated protein 2 [Geosmithia morbida]KAF4120466.1 U4/U6.U5 tri-snRNP-associated protein 2 [Geosmithia morbida]
MSKRQASEALESLSGVASPASKKSRMESATPPPSLDTAAQASSSLPNQRPDQDEDEDEDEDGDDEPDGTTAAAGQGPRPIRQTAPTDGYADLYLDTIDRNVLDFDFEKLCSVSLSNINVYACLVCGRYFQGRGPKSHAYFHSLDEDHHVYINLETQRVYVLPEGYEVRSQALDDIRYVADPRYTRAEAAALDRPRPDERRSVTLSGKEYTPGFVGMNNIKDNDYVNVVVQALAHVGPLRNFFLLEDLAGRSELVRRCSALVRKVWNPRAFKAQVSPHELLQEVALRSGRRFTLTAQSDPADFLSWFLNNLHLGLGGSKTKPGSSMIQRTFQGRLRVESQAITAARDGDGTGTGAGTGAGDRLRFEDAAELRVDVARFLLLTLDLPDAPLFQDELERNIIPQVPLPSILSKYDGVSTQEHHAQRKRYRLLHPLPPFLIFHVKRFSQNKFVSERNPTIVNFDPRNLDMSPYVEPDPAHAPPSEPIWYDLVANVVHEAVRLKDDVADTADEKKTWKVQVRDKATGRWVVCQDLFVDDIQPEMLYLGEAYLQIWERRRTPSTVVKGKTTS